jgi:NADH-quinone oxidoreductase subunit F
MAHDGGRKQDADCLLHIARNIQGRTVCAFGEACAWPVLSFVTKFKEEFEARGLTDEAKLAVSDGDPASPQASTTDSLRPGLGLR